MNLSKFYCTIFYLFLAKKNQAEVLKKIKAGQHLQFLWCFHILPHFGLSSVILPCTLDMYADRLFLYRLHKQAWLNQWRPRSLIFWPTSIRASQRAYSFTGRGPLPVDSLPVFVILPIKIRRSRFRHIVKQITQDVSDSLKNECHQSQNCYMQGNSVWVNS